LIDQQLPLLSFGLRESLFAQVMQPNSPAMNCAMERNLASHEAGPHHANLLDRLRHQRSR
jgi:hypothetical protein